MSTFGNNITLFTIQRITIYNFFRIHRVGQKSPRLVRNAAHKLAQELFSMIKRPEYAIVTRCLEG